MSEGFFKTDRPTLTTMLKSRTVGELISEIGEAIEQGTDALLFQMEILVPEDRTKENYKRVFYAMQGKPSYVTNYIRGNALPKTDEELVEELFFARECGATLIDIRGDLFDRQPGELSLNPEAVKKQKEVIKEFKALGAEVLMSSHVLKYIPGDEVLKIALAQEERGVDVAKVVTEANSEAELLDNFRTTLLLHEKLSCSSLFLCNGSHCARHRLLAPLMCGGKNMFLTVVNSFEGAAQPKIERAKEILTLGGFTDLP